MSLQNSFSAPCHKVSKVYWRNETPFFQKIFTHLMFWWWWWSMRFTSFLYWWNHSVSSNALYGSIWIHYVSHSYIQGVFFLKFSPICIFARRKKTTKHKISVDSFVTVSGCSHWISYMNADGIHAAMFICIMFKNAHKKLCKQIVVNTALHDYWYC